MEDINILVAIAMFMAGIFGMAGLRLWFITHQDVNMSKKVNGLSIDMGKVKKALKDGYAGVQGEPLKLADVAKDAPNMDVAQFVEMLGFDAKELDNPIVAPLVEKVFKSIQGGMHKTDEKQVSDL